MTPAITAEIQAAGVRLVLEEALEQLKVKNPRVTLRAQDSEGFTMRLEWT